MKIADIKVGEEYAVRIKHLDEPRRVKVLGIKVVPEFRWDNITNKRKDINIRKVEVKYLDEPSGRLAWHGNPAKGAKGIVSAVDIAAKWSEVSKGIRDRAEERDKCEALEASLEKRLKKLLGRSYDGYVHVRSSNRPDLSVHGKSLEKLLALAEAGKEVQV